MPVDPDEGISLSVCGTPSPTPNVAVIASSVAAGVVGSLVILVLVIAVVALILTRKKQKKTKQELK